MFKCRLIRPTWVALLKDDVDEENQDRYEVYPRNDSQQDDFNEEDYEITGYDLNVDWHK